MSFPALLPTYARADVAFIRGEGYRSETAHLVVNREGEAAPNAIHCRLIHELPFPGLEGFWPKATSPLKWIR